jgi:hypothetical protein
VRVFRPVKAQLTGARRIDDTWQFIASVLSSFVSEWIGALVTARTANIEFDCRNAGCELLRTFKSSRVLQSSVHPLKQDTGPSSGKEAPASSRELALGEAGAASRSPDRPSEAAETRNLLLAVKIAHEELGEKTALFLGCAVAARVGGLSSEWAAKAFALLLFETVSDVAKASVYAARNIDVGHARFNFHLPSLLGVALVGGASWAGLMGAIGLNCFIGEDVASVFG